MVDDLTFSSNVEQHNSTDIPSGWLDSGRKLTIIAGKFIAFKTPLDDRFKASITSDKRWTCTILIENMMSQQKKLGLVINLNHYIDQYYLSTTEFIQKNIGYKQIQCQKDDEIPNDEQIVHFIQICDDFIHTNPNDIIGVHCTCGLNRTGFFICAYLSRKLNYNIYDAVAEFKKARSPGSIRQDFLNELYHKFHNQHFISRGIKEIPNIIPIDSQPLLDNIRLKYQQMCRWNRNTFPGSKPVSMNYINYESICVFPYLVSWKADGIRCIMFIENEDAIYMLDRNNDVFQIYNLRFLNKSDYSKHLKNTLIDGELVIDNANGKKIYQYLVFDIIIYENENIGQKPFNERLKIINDDIIAVRNQAIKQNLIDKSSEPLSIQTKGFWELSSTSKLLGSSFQSKLTHGSDGLIFQPKLDPYQCGRSSKVLKWNTNNTIDFRLKIDKTERSQEKRALLFLNDLSSSFASMPYSPILDQYDNQIIECLYRNGVWIFHRHRSEKNYPNTTATAEGVNKALERPITLTVLFYLINEHLAFDDYR